MLDALLFPTKELAPLPLFMLISFAFMFVCYFLHEKQLFQGAVK